VRAELLGIERRRRWTREQKLAVLSEIGVDGASISDVARRHDVPRQNLYQWRHDLRSGGLGEGAGVTFIPVAPAGDPQCAAARRPAIEIVLRNGRGLRGFGTISEDELIHLIRVIERA